MSKPDLKPCPFCGTEYPDEGVCSTRGHFVQCSHFCCEAKVYTERHYDSEKEEKDSTYKKWNTRYNEGVKIEN